MNARGIWWTGALLLSVLVCGCGKTVSGGGSTASADFALAVAPQSVSLGAGSSQTVTVSTSSLNGFADNVTVSAAGLPAGVSVSPSSFSLGPQASKTVTISAAPNAAPVTAAIAITGTSGTLQHVATINTTVSGAPDFSISLAPASLTLAAGGSQSTTVSVQGLNGFTGQVSIATSGLPAGVTVSPATLSLAPGASQSVTFTAAANTAAASATVTMQATSGSLSHTAQLALTTTAAAPPPDFSLSVSPQSLNLTQGASGTISVAIAAANGFSGQASLALSGLPSGVTASPASATLTPGTTQTITLSAAGNAATGPATLTLTATSGTLVHTAQVGLTVAAPAPDFSFSANPSDIQISAGSSQPVALSAAALNGFSGFASISVAGLPPGVTLSPAPLALAPGVGQQLMLTAASTAAASTAAVTFTASAGGVWHTSVVNLKVVPQSADFTLAAGPGTLLVDPGQTQLEIAQTGSSTPVNVTVSGLPQGVTATPANFQLLSSPQAIAITVASGAPAATGILSFAGVSGSLQHTVAVPITVTTGPEVIQMVTPASLSLNQNSTASLTLALASTEDLAAQTIITSTLEGLPAGVFVNGMSGTVPLPATQPETVTVPVHAVDDAPAGSATLGFHTSLGTQVASVALSVVATPSFSLRIAPAALALAPGRSQTIAITATSLSGFSGAVDVSFSGLPAGITAQPSSLSLTPGAAQNITFSAGSGFTAGGTATLDAISGNISQSQPLAFTALAAAPTGLVTNGLLAYFPMNEGTGTTIHDAGPSAYTVNFGGSGNTWVPGGVQLNGSGWIDLPAALNGAQTVQMWVSSQQSSASAAEGLIGSSAACCSGVTQWELSPASSGSAMRQLSASSNGTPGAISSTPFAGAGTLTFAMGSAAQSTSDQYWIDDQQVFYRDIATGMGGQTSGTSAGGQTNGNYQLGALAGASGLKGIVGPVAFYNRQLQPAEIAANAAYFDQLQQSRGLESQQGNTVASSEFVGIGDSITYGYPAGPYCGLVSFNDRSYDLHCLGVVGQTSVYGLAEAPQLAQYYAADGAKNVFLVWFGTNDVTTSTPAAQIMNNLLDSCSAIKQVYPSARVLLGTMLSRYHNFNYDPAKNALNALIRQNAGISCDGFVDFAADPGLGADGAYAGSYFVDQTHPSALGYQHIADIVSRWVNSIDGASASHPTLQSASTYAMTSADNYVQAPVSGAAQWTLPECIGLTGRVYEITNTGAGTINLAGAGSESISGSATIAGGSSGRFQATLVGASTGGCSWTRVP